METVSVPLRNTVRLNFLQLIKNKGELCAYNPELAWCSGI